MQNGKRYELQHLLFHAPSEHNINSQPADMEVQLVHKANDNQLAVVAILLNEGDNHDDLDTLWEYMPNEKGEVRNNKKFNAADLLPKKRGYFHYSGSLTTPPCRENVQWSVLANPLQLSAEQISQFTNVFPNNARPLQPIHQRKISQQ